MKKYFFIIVIFLTNAITFGQSNQIIQKIGFVDSQIILSQYPEAIKAQSDLDAMIEGWNTQIDNLTSELQNGYTLYQQQEATMTPEKKQEAQQELIVKEQTIQQLRQEKFGQNGEAYVKQEELFAPIKQKILDVIDVVRKEEGMNFVFDKAGDVILLFADPQFDLTNAVLDRLKRG